MWSLGIPASLPVFPADCPHPADCHCRHLRARRSSGEYRGIHRGFQHTAGFVNGTTAVQPIVTAAVYRGFSSELHPGEPGLTPPLNLPAPGRLQTLYVRLRRLQSPVFLVNSRLGHFTATPSRFDREDLHGMGVHLLPKLRCYFAEFLHGGSLKRLGLLTLPTCVRFRYGHPALSLEVFLGSVESAALRPDGLEITSRRLEWGSGFAYHPRLRASNCTSNRSPAYPSASPHRDNENRVVQEC